MLSPIDNYAVNIVQKPSPYQNINEISHKYRVCRLNFFRTIDEE